MQGDRTFRQLFRHLSGADGVPADTLPGTVAEPPQRAAVSSRSPLHGTTPRPARAGQERDQRPAHGGKLERFRSPPTPRRARTVPLGRWAITTSVILPYYWNVAQRYVLFDRFFGLCAVRGTAPTGTTGSPAGHNPVAATRSRPPATATSLTSSTGAGGGCQLEVLRAGLSAEGDPSAPRRQGDQASQTVRVPLLNYDPASSTTRRSTVTSSDLDQYYQDLSDGTLRRWRTSRVRGPASDPPGPSKPARPSSQQHDHVPDGQQLLEQLRR